MCLLRTIDHGWARRWGRRVALGSSLGMAVAPALGCSTPPASPEATFDALWEDFDQMYGGFELRGIDWDDAYDRYRPLVHDDMSDDELFAVMAAMLAETDDGHVQLTVPGREHWSADRIHREGIGDERFDLELVRHEYLDDQLSTDAWAEHTLGTLPSGHPYVHFSGIGDQMPILSEVRDEAEAAGGLVLDLRHNCGGDFTWGLQALASWCATPRPVFRSRTRNGPGREDFTPWFQWPLECHGTDIDFPVVVLVDRFTISAGERIVLTLDTFETVTFLGETTNGAISTVVGRELPNGWYEKISTQEVLSPDGTTVEGKGFSPDQVVVNDPAQMALGIDEVLEQAIVVLEQAGGR